MQSVELSYGWSLTKGQAGVRIKTQQTSNVENKKRRKKYCCFFWIDLNEGNLIKLWSPWEGFTNISLWASWKPVKFVDTKDRRRKNIIQTCQKGYGQKAWLPR